jgi:TonB family protein
VRRRLLAGLGCAALVALASARAADADPAAPPAVAARRPADEDAVPHGPTLEARLRAIQERVQAALEYPPLARMRRTEGVALLSFAIGADGRAKQIAVAHSSGFAVLDRAAERAVRSAEPLPYVYGRLEIPVRFELEARTPDSVAASP